MTVTFCEAIARQEGWLVPLSRCRRNHNPGNLVYEPWEKAFGATLEGGYYPRFAQFPTDQQGFNAQSHLLIFKYAGLAIVETITDWAPPTDNNDTQAYINNVCEWTGLTPQTVLTIPMLQPPKIAG